MKKILYDKTNKKESRIQWFTDQDGNHWFDIDPHGVDMSSTVRIQMVTPECQYEVREVTESKNYNQIIEELYILKTKARDISALKGIDSDEFKEVKGELMTLSKELNRWCRAASSSTRDIKRYMGGEDTP